MGELFYRNVADFIMNRRYRMCYEYVRWISFAATSNCPMVINLYTRQNRWSIGISSLSLPPFSSFFWIRTLRLILRVSFSPVLFFFFFHVSIIFRCYLDLISIPFAPITKQTQFFIFNLSREKRWGWKKWKRKKSPLYQ